MTRDTHRWKKRLSARFGDLWCGRPGCASYRGLRMQAGRLNHKVGGEPKDIGMVQAQVTTPSPNAVGNALRGVPGPPERHGVRSLQDNRRVVTRNVDELDHAKTMSPEEAAAILERKDDLRLAGRWIRHPTEVVISICKLTKDNASQRSSTKMPAVSRRFTKTTADSRKFRHDRGIAVSARQAILRTGLPSPDTLLFSFSGRGDGETRRFARNASC
jgi:hypothetical protein